MAESPAAAPARESIVTVLATQLHQDRRLLLRGSAVFAGANLALAAIVWAITGVWLLAPGADPGDGDRMDRPAVVVGGPTRGEGVS